MSKISTVVSTYSILCLPNYISLKISPMTQRIIREDKTSRGYNTLARRAQMRSRVDDGTGTTIVTLPIIFYPNERETIERGKGSRHNENNTFLFLFLLRALLFYDPIYPGAFIGSQSQIVALSPELTPGAALALLARGRGKKAHSRGILVSNISKTEAIRNNTDKKNSSVKTSTFFRKMQITCSLLYYN